jgi:hypothetical protein
MVPSIPTTTNNVPTFAMFYNLTLTTGIVVLGTIKVLLYLKVNEEYGMLSELVFATIIDATPFTIFMFIWLLIFCVIFKIMGSMLHASESYSDITSILGYFFYMF